MRQRRFFSIYIRDIYQVIETQAMRCIELTFSRTIKNHIWNFLSLGLFTADRSLKYKTHMELNEWNQHLTKATSAHVEIEHCHWMRVHFFMFGCLFFSSFFFYYRWGRDEAKNINETNKLSFNIFVMYLVQSVYCFVLLSQRSKFNRIDEKRKKGITTKVWKTDRIPLLWNFIYVHYFFFLFIIALKQQKKKKSYTRS